MDSSSENLDESMLDVIQRAEAFITAHSFLNREAERSSSNIFDVSGESFRTAADDSSLANDSGSNTSGGPSTSGADHSANIGNNTTAEVHSGEQEQVEVLSDDSQATEPYDINDPPVDPSPRTAAVDNDDCIVIEVPDHVVDLCSPYAAVLVSPQSRRARRRRADAAPVVESITLDDTVVEAPPQATPTLTTSSPPKKRKPVAPVQHASQHSEPAGAAVPSVSVACPICLESIFHQQAASTVCGHLFCKQCINQEIQIRKKCPMCKRPLKRQQVHPIYFN